MRRRNCWVWGDDGVMVLVGAFMLLVFDVCDVFLEGFAMWSMWDLESLCFMCPRIFVLKLKSLGDAGGGLVAYDSGTNASLMAATRTWLNGRKPFAGS